MPATSLRRRNSSKGSRSSIAASIFEQHETLELLWRAERRDIRYLYQGILQIGVAFHQSAPA